MFREEEMRKINASGLKLLWKLKQRQKTDAAYPRCPECDAVMIPEDACFYCRCCGYSGCGQ